MGKGQFTEFLNSIGRIMEESISKGFTKSTEEIAGNMQMLYKLSGSSPLWQGEQGAQRLSQMNAGISNATNLQTTGDVISYSAAKQLLMADNPNGREGNFWRLTGNHGVAVTGNANFRSSADGGDNIIGTLNKGQSVNVLGREGDYYRIDRNGREGYIHNSLLTTSGNAFTGTYVDTMQLLERGLSADFLKNQWSMVRGFEGDNVAAQIEWYKQMYGLNYTGATQVWAMSENAWDRNTGDWRTDFNASEFEKQIKDLQADTNFRSDSQLLKDTLNSLKNDGIKIGQVHFNDTELGLLRSAQSDIALIRMKLLGSPGERLPENMPVPSAALPIAPLPFPGSVTMGALQNEISRGRWDRMSQYYDTMPDTETGKIMLGRVGTGINAIDFERLTATQNEILGIELENFAVNFTDRMRGGISDREYREINYNGQFERLINALENFAREQSTLHVTFENE
jgi:hypothetical protein